MRLFKRKKKENKMDFSGYTIKLSIKSICMFERLTRKSFFSFTEEDVMALLYCAFYTSNNMEIKYETFISMLENEKIATWAVNKYKDLLDVIQQFKKEDNTGTQGDGQVDTKELTMTDMATSLIVDYHLDAHYVMYEMGLWEIEPMYQACDASVKRRYEENRLWAYIDVMPHIDSKKIKGPNDLLPFPWEKTKKVSIEKQLEMNTAAAVAFLGGKKDGEGRNDN